MSKKIDFLDMCQKHVQDVDIFFGGTRGFFWRDINTAPKTTPMWRDSIIAPYKVAGLTLAKAMTSPANTNSLWPLTTTWQSFGKAAR
jgi:hypothetical protein